MTTTHTPASTTTERTSIRGQRVPLATYQTDTGERRQLIGQRIEGIVHIYDEPTDKDGTSYLVEQGLTTTSELTALIDDYTTKAEQLGYPPMHGWF